jgi:hypothetical protein
MDILFALMACTSKAAVGRLSLKAARFGRSVLVLLQSPPRPAPGFQPLFDVLQAEAHSADPEERRHVAALGHCDGRVPGDSQPLRRLAQGNKDRRLALLPSHCHNVPHITKLLVSRDNSFEHYHKAFYDFPRVIL